MNANRASNPRVFGSVYRGEDTEDSDLDILVDADPKMTLFDISRIELELQDILGVPVHLLLTESVPPEKYGDYIARSRKI